MIKVKAVRVKNGYNFYIKRKKVGTTIEYPTFDLVFQMLVMYGVIRKDDIEYLQIVKE